MKQEHHALLISESGRLCVAALQAENQLRKEALALGAGKGSVSSLGGPASKAKPKPSTTMTTPQMKPMNSKMRPTSAPVIISGYSKMKLGATLTLDEVRQAGEVLQNRLAIASLETNEIEKDAFNPAVISKFIGMGKGFGGGLRRAGTLLKNAPGITAKAKQIPGIAGGLAKHFPRQTALSAAGVGAGTGLLGGAAMGGGRKQQRPLVFA